MHLLPDLLFSIPSDNVSMISIVGTTMGRVFLAGKDGCLYELLYQVRQVYGVCECESTVCSSRKRRVRFDYMYIIHLPIDNVINDVNVQSHPCVC